MKILILDSYYPMFLDVFYRKYPELERADYETQRQALLAENFGTGDFFSHNLKDLGHEAEEIILNCGPLQKRWAKEHNVWYRPDWFRNIRKLRTWFKSDWPDRVIEAQIKKYKPDVLYCHDLRRPPRDLLLRIRPYVKLIVGQIASPFDFEKEKADQFDLILTSFPHFVERFKNIGVACEYVKLAFESRLLEQVYGNHDTYGAVFVGGFSRWHNANIALFEYLAQNNAIEIWGYGAKHLPLESAARKHHHSDAWGTEMYQIYADAKICVNRHIETAENYANNMRLYEATGMGTLVITEKRDNLLDIFEPGKEIETYETKEELLEKICYYLAHDDERQKIAKTGQERTLKDHTYRKRMEEIITIIKKYIS